MQVARRASLSVQEPPPIFPVPATYNGNPIDTNQDSTVGWRAFLGSVPNGGIVQLANDVRVDQITPLNFREDLTFDLRGQRYISDWAGNGTAGDLGRQKMLFRLRQCSGVRFTSSVAGKGQLIGSHHDASGTNTLPYDSDYEFQTGIELQSCDRIVMERLDFKHIGGSGTRWTIDENTPTKRCTQVRMSDCDISGTGHLGVALQAIEGGTVEHVRFIQTGRSAIDLEPNSNRFGAFNIWLRELDFYVGVHLTCIASVGGQYTHFAYFGPTEDVRIEDIRAHGRSLHIDVRPDTDLKDCGTIKGYNPAYGCTPDDAGWSNAERNDSRIYTSMPLHRKARYSVRRASSDDVDQTSPALRFHRVDGVWLEDIVQPMKAGQAMVSLDDCSNVLAVGLDGTPGNAVAWGRTYSDVAPTTDGQPGGWPTFYGGTGPTFDANGVVTDQFVPWELTTGADV